MYNRVLDCVWHKPCTTVPSIVRRSRKPCTTVCRRNASRVKPCQSALASVLKRVNVLAEPCQTVSFTLDSVPNRVISWPYLCKPCHTVSEIREEKLRLTVSCPCCFTTVSYHIVAFVDFSRVVPHCVLCSGLFFISNRSVYNKSYISVFPSTWNILFSTMRQSLVGVLP